MTTRSSLRRLALFVALALAGCAAGSGSGDTDNAKSHGFYGGVTGGWSHP